MYPDRALKIRECKSLDERTDKELEALYVDLKEELKVAASIFEFERASELQAEITLILEQLSERQLRRTRVDTNRTEQDLPTLRVYLPISLKPVHR